MVIHNNWFIQESPGLNRDCFCVGRLFSMKKTKILSQTLPQIGSKDTGW